LTSGPVPIYTRQQLEAKAAQFLAQYNPRGTAPTPIEVMAERFGIEIIPVPNFRDAQGHRTAALNNDVESVTIDENADRGVYRYALAHEIGHVFLHKTFIEEIAVAGANPIESWRGRLRKDDPETLSDLERQANIFARLVLLPDVHFRPAMTEFAAALPVGMDWFTVTDLVFTKMTETLAEDFGTSRDSVVKRLQDHGVTRD
jgi:Zn-dependent peptidase ImmA (M78 family)